VSINTSSGNVVAEFSNEKTPRADGGRPRGRTIYFRRTEREKLIEVFAFTLLVAARIPLAAELDLADVEALFLLPVLPDGAINSLCQNAAP
jgi:hypothetical protein